MHACKGIWFLNIASGSKGAVVDRRDIKFPEFKREHSFPFPLRRDIVVCIHIIILMCTVRYREIANIREMIRVTY